MTKEKAFDLLSAAKRAGVNVEPFTEDRQSRIQFGIAVKDIGDLWKLARKLAEIEGPEDVSVQMHDDNKQIVVL